MCVFVYSKSQANIADFSRRIHLPPETDASAPAAPENRTTATLGVDT
jgi:hypothetical protein